MNARQTRQEEELKNRLCEGRRSQKRPTSSGPPVRLGGFSGAMLIAFRSRPTFPAWAPTRVLLLAIVALGVSLWIGYLGGALHNELRKNSFSRPCVLNSPVGHVVELGLRPGREETWRASVPVWQRLLRPVRARGSSFGHSHTDGLGGGRHRGNCCGAQGVRRGVRGVRPAWPEDRERHRRHRRKTIRARVSASEGCAVP